MRKIDSVAAFKAFVSAGEGAESGALVHFGASWCPPCAELNAYIEQTLVPTYSGCGIVFAYADADVLGEICEAEGVDSVPFVCFYRKTADGSLDRVADVAGAKLPLLDLNMVSLFGRGNDDKSKFPTLNDYIKNLIQRDRIVVFITGTPSRPRCGFTRKIVDLLDQYKAKYSYVDIMADDEMCQQLKVFSNWPTFPQVYVDGELIGGSDICIQMHEEGELKAALKLE